MNLFLSYSHDSPSHRKRVLGLAERLRSDGFESHLDQYVEGTPQEGWPRWMLNELDTAEFVLVVCTETYYRRFRGHEEPGTGKGVDWEGSIITQSLYDERSSTSRFVPVLFSQLDQQHIPEPLRARTHFLLTNREAYDSLCAFLDGKSGVQPRPIGPKRPKRERFGELLTFAGDEVQNNVDHETFQRSDAQISSGNNVLYESPVFDEQSQLISRARDLRASRRALVVVDAKHSPAYDALTKELIEIKRLLRRGPQLTVGHWLDDRYELIERLGNGGFGTVWRAIDERDEQLVALKVLHGHYSEDRMSVDRFRRGARSMHRLSHPNIVTVFRDGDVIEDLGFYFFVMPYIASTTLQSAILSHSLSVQRIVHILADVADALSYSHDRGVIHRDVCPDNILLMDGYGRALLTDFDLARTDDSTGFTRTGPLGKFMFSAPEALEAANSVDARCDIYSLGMTALFCLHGCRLPVTALFSGVKSFISDLECPTQLKSLLIRATEIERDLRFPHMSDMTNALRQCAALTPTRQKVKRRPPAKISPPHRATDSDSNSPARLFRFLQQTLIGPAYRHNPIVSVLTSVVNAFDDTEVFPIGSNVDEMTRVSLRARNPAGLRQRLDDAIVILTSLTMVSSAVRSLLQLPGTAMAACAVRLREDGVDRLDDWSTEMQTILKSVRASNSVSKRELKEIAKLRNDLMEMLFDENSGIRRFLGTFVVDVEQRMLQALIDASQALNTVAPVIADSWNMSIRRLEETTQRHFALCDPLLFSEFIRNVATNARHGISSSHDHDKKHHYSITIASEGAEGEAASPPNLVIAFECPAPLLHGQVFCIEPSSTLAAHIEQIKTFGGSVIVEFDSERMVLRTTLRLIDRGSVAQSLHRI